MAYTVSCTILLLCGFEFGERLVRVSSGWHLETLMTLERNGEFPCSEFSTRFGCVHTNRVESGRVQFSPVILTKTWKRLCGLPTTAAAAVRTHQQGRVAACSIFVSQTPVIGRDGRNECTEAHFLLKDHEAIYDASHCEHRKGDELASLWTKIAEVMGVGRWSVSVFCFLLWRKRCSKQQQQQH